MFLPEPVSGVLPSPRSRIQSMGSIPFFTLADNFIVSGAAPDLGLISRVAVGGGTMEILVDVAFSTPLYSLAITFISNSPDKVYRWRYFLLPEPKGLIWVSELPSPQSMVNIIGGEKPDQKISIEVIDPI